MWPFNRKARELGSDLYLAVRSEQPVQAGAIEDAPPWATKLLRLLVATWPALRFVLLLILEDATAKLSTEDKAEAKFGLNRYRRIVESPGAAEKIAAALEVRS